MLYHYLNPQEARSAPLSTFWESVRDYLKQLGLGQGEINQAFYFVLEVESHAQNLGFFKHPQIKEFKENRALYAHALLTTMLAYPLCSALGVSRKVAVEEVGLACLFHDLGILPLLTTCGNVILHEDEAGMSSEVRALYRQHPRLSVGILSEVEGVPQSLLQLVGRHHERRNAKGFSAFPDAPEPLELTAEIVAISDQFSKYLDVSTPQPQNLLHGLNIPEEQSQLLKAEGFSPAILKSCEDVFLLFAG